MANRLAFQTQLASIMEVLANAAVAEICKLVDDDFAVINLQMSQCQQENKALKRKLHLLELRMARTYAERRIRESSQHRANKVQISADKYRTPATDIFPNQDELYGRQLNEDLWRDRDPPGADLVTGPPVKDDENMAGDSGMAGPNSVLLKSETSEDGPPQTELFIREDGLVEAVSEGGDASFGTAQVDKTDGLHSRTRRQALEPQQMEDDEPDVLFIKEEPSEQKRESHTTNRGMNVQDGYVESSTDVCGGEMSSSPAQITVALRTDDVGVDNTLDKSSELSSSLLKDSDQEEQKSISNQPAGLQITIQNVVGSQGSASFHSGEPVLPHRRATAPVGVKIWDPNSESHLQGAAESRNNPLSNQATHRRKRATSDDVMGTDYTLYERPRDLETLFTRWTENDSSAGQPSCSYTVEADQDEDCVLVQPGAHTVSGTPAALEDVSSNRFQSVRGSGSGGGTSRLEAEWTTASVTRQSQTQASHYNRAEGIQVQPVSRANHTQSIPKIHPQMMTHVTQAGLSLSGLQLPRRMEKGKRKSYICKYCGKAFTGLSNVEAHQRVHTGEKPFKCETCGKLFTEAGNLKKHQRVHTGEKPFTCSRCGKRFAWICNLRTHQQSASCGGLERQIHNSLE